MALLTNDEILARLQLTGEITAVQQAVLTQVSPAVERMVKDFVGYEIEQASHIEYYPSNSKLIESDPLVTEFEGSTAGAIPVIWGRDEARTLYLAQLPVRSITTVYENPNAWLSSPPDFSSSYLLTAGTDYYFDVDLVSQSRSRTESLPELQAWQLV